MSNPPAPSGTRYPAPVVSWKQVEGEIPFATPRQPAERRLPGLVLECPLCAPFVDPTYLHPIDSRTEVRPAAYGSDSRLVVNILAACEHENHVVILEVTNKKGQLNMGFRAPFSGELVSEWWKGTFDSSAVHGGVRFNERYDVTADAGEPF